MAQGVTQVRMFIESNQRAEKLKTLQAELGLAKAQQDKKDIEDLLKVGRSVAAPSRRELDFSIAVKKRDGSRDYLRKNYCANQPGDAMDPDSDEFKIQEMLLKDPADVMKTYGKYFNSVLTGDAILVFKCARRWAGRYLRTSRPSKWKQVSTRALT